jgi:DNA-directed RNA polymerase specialized sigma subunit
MDMTEVQRVMQRLQAKRNSIIRKLLSRGFGPAHIGRELGVSRQRAQQLIKRLNGNCS